MTIDEIKAMLEIARAYDAQCWGWNVKAGINEKFGNKEQAQLCRSLSFRHQDRAAAIREAIRAALEVKEPEPTEWLSERLANGNDLSLEEAKRLADNRAAASERQLKAAYDKGYLDGMTVEREWY